MSREFNQVTNPKIKNKAPIIIIERFVLLPEGTAALGSSVLATIDIVYNKGVVIQLI